MIRKRYACAEYFVFPQNFAHLIFENHPVGIRISPSQLMTITNEMFASIVPKSFTIKAPVVNKMKLIVREVLVTEFQLPGEGRIENMPMITTAVDLEVWPSISLVPAFKGQVALRFHLSISVVNNLPEVLVDVKSFDWLTKPTTLKGGKPLPMLEKISSFFMRSFSAIEQLLANNVKEQLEPSKLLENLAKMPTSFPWLGQYVLIKELDLTVSNIAFQSSGLQVSLTVNGTIIPCSRASQDAELSIVYASLSVNESTSITIHKKDLDFVSPLIITAANRKIDQKLYRIAKLQFALEPEVLSMIVQPERILENGLRADFSVRYGHKERTLHLKEVTIASNAEASLIFRTILKLVNSRIEAEVQNQFPLKADDLIDAIQHKIIEINKEGKFPLLIVLEDIDIFEFRLARSSIRIEMSYHLDFFSRDLDQLIS